MILSRDKEQELCLFISSNVCKIYKKGISEKNFLSTEPFSFGTIKIAPN
jgi:hypothetical protein